MVKKVFIVIFILIGSSGCLESGNADRGDASAVKLREHDSILHYWDNFAFNDSSGIRRNNGQDSLEYFFSELASLPDTVRDQAILQMLSKAHNYPGKFDVFFQEVEKYLYDPNSPVRNDAYYQTALEYVLDSVALDSAGKVRREMRLDLVRKNQVGELAHDFTFELNDGELYNLHDITAPYLLLFFYEPGCPHCEQAFKRLKGSSAFQRLLEKKKLKILLVYPFGDEELWKEYQSEIPQDWMNGMNRNAQIITDNVYDLKATPTIYLLDQDKKVLLKDSDLAHVVLFFSTNRI